MRPYCTFLSEKPVHWDEITTLPWTKVANVLKATRFFLKCFLAAKHNEGALCVQVDITWPTTSATI